MNVRDLVKRIEQHWRPNWTDREMVYEDYFEVLQYARPETIDRLWAELLKTHKAASAPKPAHLYELLGKPKTPGSSYTRNMKEFLEYVDRRAPEIVEDWKVRNPELWREAVRDGWDYPLMRGDNGFADRAKMLAQMEYGLKNEGATIDHKKAGIHQLRDEEIRDAANGVLQLSAREGQIDRCRRIARAPKTEYRKVGTFRKPANKAVEEARRAAHNAKAEPTGQQQEAG